MRRVGKAYVIFCQYRYYFTLYFAIWFWSLQVTNCLLFNRKSCMYICMHVRACVCMYVYVHACMYVSVCMCIYICTLCTKAIDESNKILASGSSWRSFEIYPRKWHWVENHIDIDMHERGSRIALSSRRVCRYALLMACSVCVFWDKYQGGWFWVYYL